MSAAALEATRPLHAASMHVCVHLIRSMSPLPDFLSSQAILTPSSAVVRMHMQSAWILSLDMKPKQAYAVTCRSPGSPKSRMLHSSTLLWEQMVQNGCEQQALSAFMHRRPGNRAGRKFSFVTMEIQELVTLAWAKAQHAPCKSAQKMSICQLSMCSSINTSSVGLHSIPFSIPLNVKGHFFCQPHGMGIKSACLCIAPSRQDSEAKTTSNRGSSSCIEGCPAPFVTYCQAWDARTSCCTNPARSIAAKKLQ